MRSITVFAVAVLLLGCASDLSTDPAAATRAQKTLVRDYMERLINNGEWTAWDEFFGESVAFNGTTMSRSDMVTMATTFSTILEGYHLNVEEQIAEGNVVATRVTVSGKHTGDYMGLRASGKDLTFRGLALDRIEDGKVVEMWHELDLWGTLLMASDDDS